MLRSLIFCLKCSYVPKTTYITIDTCPDGTLSPVVCVWGEKPVRHPGYNKQPKAVVWLDAAREDTSVSMGVAECKDRYGTVPDNDEMLIRIGKKKNESNDYN